MMIATLVVAGDRYPFERESAHAYRRCHVSVGDAEAAKLTELDRTRTAFC
jgi:hypothetical protein